MWRDVGVTGKLWEGWPSSCPVAGGGMTGVPGVPHVVRVQSRVQGFLCCLPHLGEEGEEGMFMPGVVAHVVLGSSPLSEPIL